MNALRQALAYHGQGLACYPFQAGSKSQRFDALRFVTWGEFRDTPQTAREVELLFSDRQNANIALVGGRASDGAFFIDTDNSQQFAAVSNLLAGYGIQTATVQRDTFQDDDNHAGGGHFWLRAPVAVETHKTTLGEVRGQGAYVIAPPSTHPTGGEYRFRDVNELFRLPVLSAIPELELKPAPAETRQRRIPALAQRLLEGDRAAIARYSSRSEAEAAIMSSLIRAGFSYEMILIQFHNYPAAGKFQELMSKPKAASQYFDHTYQQVSAYLAANANDATTLAHNLRAWATAKPWPGRTGSTDRAVYLAHLSIVSQCGKAENYAASCRDLAELSGTHWQTAMKANHRLVKDGLIELAKEARPELANRWNVTECLYSNTPSCIGMTDCSIKGTLPVQPDHDAWRWSGLGKTGCEVYHALLTAGEAGPAELAQATGRGLRTVKRKLAKMAGLGMADSDNGRWQANPVNLDSIAHVLDTAGQGKRQQQQHRQQRRQHKLMLARLSEAQK